jgi:hypothetical protein
MRAISRQWLMVAMAGLLAGTAWAATLEPEKPANTKRLLAGRVAMDGQGYRLAPSVPVQDFMARFRVQTDVGVLEAVGSEELLERLAELPAARRLQGISQSEVFGRALSDSAKATGQAITRVVTQPVETLAALPAGIGRALVSVGRRARTVATNIGDYAKRDSDPVATEAGASQGESAKEPMVDFGKELAGVNKARRAIARNLGVDPYTRNPLLAKRLEELAWASVAGGISVDLALAAVPRVARDALDVADELDQLAWEAPPADVRRVLGERLQARGHGGFEAREFLRNPAFSPSDQLRFVDLLEDLDVRDGERALLVHASRVGGPRHARFLLRQLEMLGTAQARDPLRTLYAVDGLVWAATRKGEAILPLPVDQLSWTASIAGALTGEDPGLRPAARILVTGSVTPLARANLRRIGWRVETGIR